jgi:NTE family protein
MKLSRWTMKLRFLLCYSLCLVTLIFSTPLRADKLTIEKQHKRPKVGLALGGGGAKGSAHIGVLKVLEAHNIPVDFIAGTSIGAYVGGMYALGYSPAQIEQFMLAAKWDEGYSDQIPRQDLLYRDKQLRDQYNLPFQLGYEQETFKMPAGILLGQNISRLLRDSTGLVPRFDSFDELAIPFRAITTDLATKQAVVLDSGSIVEAMQASASVPGIVKPLQINGRALVDGGIANNLPIDVVKEMGADVVIAVDISSEYLAQDKLNTTIDVLMQLSNMLTIASTEAQKKLLARRDILIRPDVAELSTTDWSVLPTALEKGQQAAQQQISQFDYLAMSQRDFNGYLTLKKMRSDKWLRERETQIVAIALNNQSNISDQLILDNLGVAVGDVVDNKGIERATQNVYGLNKFETVSMDFKQAENGRILVVNTTAKSWGPNFVEIGASIQDDFSSDAILSLDLAYTLTELNRYGGEWRNEVSMGFEKYLATEWYQPFDEHRHYYGRMRVQSEREDWRVTDDNSMFVNLKKDSWEWTTGLGANLGRNSQIELGYVADTGKIENKDLSVQRIDYNQQGWYLSFSYDDLNDINFPTSGNQVRMQFFHRDEQYSQTINDGNKLASSQFNLDWRGAVSVNNHALLGMASYTKYDGDGAFTINQAKLGGFLNLSGYGRESLIGENKAFAALVYQYDLGRDMLGLNDYPLYLGLSIESGAVWDGASHVKQQEMLGASSVYIGSNTALGPLSFGVGLAEQGHRSVFISLGKNYN